jgi:hypothetical protein
MKHYYRISPVLWTGIPGNYEATVYGIDRMPHGPLASLVCCTPRSYDDPAYFWAGATFLRLKSPRDLLECCSGPQNIWDAVVWATLPAWLSYVRSLGYTTTESNYDPYKDITLIYEE